MASVCYVLFWRPVIKTIIIIIIIIIVIVKPWHYSYESIKIYNVWIYQKPLSYNQTQTKENPCPN